MVMLTTATVWGMPGQVAFAGLYAVGATFLIFIAVTLANMRMMLMVISGANILNIKKYKLSLFRQVIIFHLMAITSWAQIGYMKDKLIDDDLIKYYTGFSVSIFMFGMTGTLIGFYIGGIISNEILRILIFITPLYILLLVVNSKETFNKISVYLGGLLVIIFYPIAGTWSILISGIFGGSLALLLTYKLKNKFMNIEYTNLEKVLAIVLLFSNSIWRLIGAIFYNKISEDGILIKWINAVAYSMVSAVMMMILVYPSGILANTSIEHRLIALGIGIC